MSEFLKLAYELISKIIYNLTEWIVNFFSGFVKVFITGWTEYKLIVDSYFGSLNAIAKILAIVLIALLIAIPIAIIVIIIRGIILNAKLRADGDDNVVLYREIGRLNKQVLALMDEKNKILSMKIGTTGAATGNPYIGGAVLDGAGSPVVVQGGGIGDPMSGLSSVDGVTTVGVQTKTVGSSAVPFDDISGEPVGSVTGGVEVTGGTVNAVGTVETVGSGSGDSVVTGASMTSGGVVSGRAVSDPFAEDTVVQSASTVPSEGGPVSASGSPVAVTSTGESGTGMIASAAAAATAASVRARGKAEEDYQNTVIRFPKLDLVDQKYEDYEEPDFNETISLPDFVEGYRRFACSQLHLFYTPEIIRRFVAGMASSHILILEGISGTGKTSLPYSFSRYLGNPATMVSVQPSYRDRSELLGYFNEFSKKFNETEFLRALYEANYRREPSFIVLDEMNLARIEYYFAEMLSILEMPSYDEWIIDLVPVAWAGDPELMEGGKVKVSPRTWFVGTANSDDSTFTITDKVYDRAMPIELNQRAAAFECELEPRCCTTAEHLKDLYDQAKEDHPISEETMAKMIKMDNYLQTRFKLSFGNRIMKQMYDFIPVYTACGGTELGGLDYIIARKVLKKFESMNVSFVRDEIKNLIVYMEKIFGKGEMPDSIDYLNRIQNMY